MDEGMSSKITDLTKMEELSNNIQREIEDGKASNYLNQNGLDALQQMQLKQLQELQKMQEMQIKEKSDKENSESESDSEEDVKVSKKKSKSKSTSTNGIVSLLQDPAIILLLYVLISHPTILGLCGKYVPNLVEGEEGLSLTNLLIRGIILVSIYFGLKMFVLN